jgi:hypothetical protein
METNKVLFISGDSSGTNVLTTGWKVKSLIPKVILFATISRQFLGPTQPPVQWILVAMSQGKGKGKVVPMLLFN